MDNFDFKTLIEGGVFVANIAMVHIMGRVKNEIANLKIWILENFEQKKKS